MSAVARGQPRGINPEVEESWGDSTFAACPACPFTATRQLRGFSSAHPSNGPGITSRFAWSGNFKVPIGTNARCRARQRPVSMFQSLQQSPSGATAKPQGSAVRLFCRPYRDSQASSAPIVPGVITPGRGLPSLSGLSKAGRRRYGSYFRTVPSYHPTELRCLWLHD
jgi:hypothetical protein